MNRVPNLDRANGKRVGIGLRKRQEGWNRHREKRARGVASAIFSLTDLRRGARPGVRFRD